MLHVQWQRIFCRTRHYIYWVVGGGGFPYKVKEHGIGHGEFVRLTSPAIFFRTEPISIGEELPFELDLPGINYHTGLQKFKNIVDYFYCFAVSSEGRYLNLKTAIPYAAKIDVAFWHNAILTNGRAIFDNRRFDMLRE